MPKRERGPDGIVHVFPDDATDDEIRAVLEQSSPAQSPSQGRPARDWGDTMADALPVAGAFLGGTVGGAGGTVLGMGVGGVPGMAGGATVGAAGGEAFRQLINRYRGREAPATAGEAATDIGLTGAVEGAATLAFAGAPRVIRGVARSPVGAFAKGAISNLPLVSGPIKGGVRAVQRQMASRRAAPVADKLAEGYDRYMPNRSPTAQSSSATPRASAVKRGLSEGEESGSRELEQLLDATHGVDRPPVGNGLYRGPAYPESTLRTAAPTFPAPRDPYRFLFDEMIKSGMGDDVARITGTGAESTGRSALTKAGKSMLTASERAKLDRALRTR